ncbi:hypothetical protein GQF01_00740 [Paenibacillus sp. 5J-6]|uniref:Uncharacterized protein n=1 Tax=Paenibacillus silvestris TaxID=2606219 RepID=A0A6L8UT85_9BACL|nr:hypothetical protein [Paenibacillus silvestris]MZQ80681.1 hypothetical protein [Paenibacillus silvestris]
MTDSAKDSHLEQIKISIPLDPTLEYLVRIESEGGGHIQISSVLDFLENSGYSVPHRVKNLN